MEQFVLYFILKRIVDMLGYDIKCSFNDMDLNAGNVCGIYIKGSGPSQYREISSGVYLNNIARVEFVIQGALSNDSLFSILNLSDKIKRTLIRASNCSYIAPDQVKMSDGVIIYSPAGIDDGQDIEVILCKVDLLGDINFLGKSEQGLPIYSINFNIEYAIGGK